ncbi:MAG TPA: MaoC/PaaZ C-terminal domain-containing protein [Acidimicrobiales bacterium]|nr:MaoC/PaaZ C-terminal domain-containing protein [Acidimicrobiales bacterium]
MGQLYFEEVAVGDRAPVRRHTLTRTDLVRYAGASGDFNPMHHDEVEATAAGQPSVFGHGMFSMGFLGSAITDYVGVVALTSYKVRFARQTWPGEELTTHIEVAGTRADGGQHLVDLDVRLVNQDGEEKVVGQATAALPSRG